MRVGLLGGTFDPVHNGHLELAQAALNEFLLDEIVFIPSASPPHKKDEHIASYEHRCAMLEMVIQKYPCFKISYIENDLPKPSFSITTIKEIRKYYPENTEYFFIIGLDSLIDFPTWHLHNEILRNVNLLVARRYGHYEDETQLSKIARILDYKEKNEKMWESGDIRKNIFFLQGTITACSSTSVRESLVVSGKENLPLDQKIYEYIQNNHLYNC